MCSCLIKVMNKSRVKWRDFGTIWFVNMGSKITKISDKLPSLSGVAKSFEEIPKDKYVASHWQSTLLADLLCDALGFRGPWHPEYRAPSWSWTCIDDASAAMDRYRQCSKFATILDFHIYAKGSNPHGEVDDGWIKFKAPLIHVFSNEDAATRWTKGVFGFTTANQKGNGKQWLSWLWHRRRTTPVAFTLRGSIWTKHVEQAKQSCTRACLWRRQGMASIVGSPKFFWMKMV